MNSQLLVHWDNDSHIIVPCDRLWRLPCVNRARSNFKCIAIRVDIILLHWDSCWSKFNQDGLTQLFTFDVFFADNTAECAPCCLWSLKWRMLFANSCSLQMSTENLIGRYYLLTIILANRVQCKHIACFGSLRQFTAVKLHVLKQKDVSKYFHGLLQVKTG